MGENPLARLSNAVKVLENARTLPELTKLHDMATAAKAYAKAEQLGADAEAFAGEIRTRAGRKAGELLRSIDRATGHEHLKSGPEIPPVTPGHPTLAELGVTKRQSRTWQRLAAVPADRFEQQVEAHMSETAIAREAPTIGPKVKRNGYTEQQSLRGLVNTAVQVRAIAEALDAGELGDWSRLYGHADAQAAFAMIEEHTTVLAARLRRAVKDWKRARGETAA